MNEIAKLTAANRREKIHNAVMNVKMPAAVKKIVEDYASEQGVSAGTVVRWALADYLEARGLDGAGPGNTPG